MTFVKKLPRGKQPISTRWVFAIKKDANNKIIKRKARLVARGFAQRYGIDYELTYSPTLNVDCIKLLLAFAAQFQWTVYQLDFKSAYLNAALDKEIYTEIPYGDENYGKGYWILNKALYGLKQSGRQWNKTITKFLTENKFHQSTTDPCVFFKKQKEELTCIIGLYVDDMLIIGENFEIVRIVSRIKDNFKVSKCGFADFILGIKIERENNDIYISQEAFIDNLLNKYSINNKKKIKSPCSVNENNEDNEPVDKIKFKSIIGSLIYLARCTRPDIAFAVNFAARKSENPTQADWKKAIKILKYLNGTKHYKIRYDGKGKINAHTDSDFAGDPNDRKSTSGHIILMGTNPISWYSKKQTTVATSTAEAEYLSTTECIKKVLQIKNLLYELFGETETIDIYRDNEASKSSIKAGHLNPKLRHISVSYHFNNENILNKNVQLKYISTNDMLADPLTKNLNGNTITNFTNKIFIK